MGFSVNLLGGSRDLYSMKRNSEQITTEWLVLKSQAGDKTAFEALARIWYPKMLRYAGALSSDSDIAEDAVQATFLEVSSKLGRLRDEAAFPAWCYRILQTQVVNQARAKQKFVKTREFDVKAMNELSTSENEEEYDFSKALRKLNRDLYLTVHLFYLEGFSIAETANLLAIPQGTVKSRLFAARKEVKQFLKGENHE